MTPDEIGLLITERRELAARLTSVNKVLEYSTTATSISVSVTDSVSTRDAVFYSVTLVSETASFWSMVSAEKTAIENRIDVLDAFFGSITL